MPGTPAGARTSTSISRARRRASATSWPAELLAFLAFAPTPSYGAAELAAIRAEPIVAEALAAAGERGGLLPALLPRLRERRSLSTAQLAAELVAALGLARDREAKTAGYLERLERGELEPARVSRRVFDALARVLGVAPARARGRRRPERLGAAPPRRRSAPTPTRPRRSARTWSCSPTRSPRPAAQDRDEVDDLFLGGR